MPSEKDGVMIILSSPSGAGKTTLVKKLSGKDNFEILNSLKINLDLRPHNLKHEIYYKLTQEYEKL